MTDDVQAGYKDAPARDRFHSTHKTEFYYGWKECQRLGIPYTPEPMHHSNVYRRIAYSDGGKVVAKYELAEGLAPMIEKAVKYEYPIGMSDEEKRKFRAAARKAARSSL